MTRSDTPESFRAAADIGTWNEGMGTLSNDVGVKISADREVNRAVKRERRRNRSVEPLPSLCQAPPGP